MIDSWGWLLIGRECTSISSFTPQSLVRKLQIMSKVQDGGTCVRDIFMFVQEIWASVCSCVSIQRPGPTEAESQTDGVTDRWSHRPMESQRRD